MCATPRSVTHLEDVLAAIDVRQVDRDLAIKAAWAKDGLVQNVDAVGASQHNHTSCGLKPVHLHQQLVQCVLVEEARTKQESVCHSHHNNKAPTGTYLSLIVAA